MRARAARLELGRWVLLGLAAAAGVLLLAALLVLLKQDWARLPGWAFAAGTFAAAFVVGIVRARKALTDDLEAARRLGAIAPSDASDLLSAVELSRSVDEGTSSSLARAHLARMSAVASVIDPRPAVRRTVLWRALGVLGGVGLLHAALVIAGGDRARATWAFLTFRPTDGANLFAPEPIAGDVTLTYRYPAHTGKPIRTVAGTAGDISAPKGTVVAIEAHADRDVAKAFAMYGDKVLPLRVSEGRRLAGELIVQSSGEWRLRYTKESGRVVAEGPPRPVVVEPDAPPRVTLRVPEDEIEVKGDENLELEFDALDDFGLSEVTLVWSFGRGGEEQKKVLSRFPTDLPRRHRGEETWDLKALGLAAGDRVMYRIEAVDNDGVDGAKRGVSDTHVLKVFSRTEHHAEILRRAEEQWERLVDGLGDRLVEPPAGEKPETLDDSWKALTRRNDETLASVAESMQSLSAELARDENAPPEIGRALGHVGRRVGQTVARTTDSRGAFLRRPAPPGARSLGSTLAAEVKEEEQGVLYLEDLFDRQRLLDLAEMSRELQHMRQELTDLVKKYKESPDEETKRELMSELARLKERLHQLFKRMQALQERIQDRHLNEEAAESLDEARDMMSELDEIQKQLAEGNTDEALKALEELQKQLEKMEQEFREGAGEVDPEMEELGRELQQFASDLMDLEAEQKALRERTERLREKQREAQKEKLEKLGEEFVKQQRERVAKAARELEQISPDTAEMLALDEELQQALERLAQLDLALQGGEFDEALDQVRRAEDNAEILKLRLEAEAASRGRFPGLPPTPGLEESAEGASQAGKPIADVREALEKLMRETRPKLDEQQQKELRELSKQQGEAQRRADQLKDKLREIGNKAPVLGPEQEGMLEEAGQQMGKAQGSLEQTDPRGASSRQGEALEKLQALREAMQEANQQGGGGGGGIPMPFPNMGQEGGGEGGQGTRNERVEIPSADESRAPEEFRKDILDAMKDEAPDGYRERVRDYYEELVK